MAQPQLFAREQAPRATRVVRMRVMDAGHADCVKGHLVRYVCWKCDHDDGWHEVRTVTEGRKGAPCPKCNAAPRGVMEDER